MNDADVKNNFFKSLNNANCIYVDKLVQIEQMNDKERTKCLESKGFKVIRFSNEEVLGDIEGTIIKIKTYIDENKRT